MRGMSNPGAWARAEDGHWTTRKDVPDITFAVTRPVSSPARSFQGTVWGITGYPSLPGQQSAVQPPNSHSSRIAARRQDHAAQRAAILSRGGDSPGRVVKATAEEAAAEQAAAERAAAVKKAAAERAAAEQAAVERAAAVKKAAAERAAAEQAAVERVAAELTAAELAAAEQTAEQAAAERAAAEQALAEHASAEQAAAEQVLTHRPPYGFVSHAEWSPPVPFVSHAES